MPRRTAAKKRERLDIDLRRSQLLSLGLAVFSTRSYDDVSIADLAHAAGVSKGLLYHYFPTKRHFYVAALAEAASQLIAATSRATVASTPAKQIRAGLEAYLDYVEQRGAAYLALMRGGIGSDPEVAAIVDGARAVFFERVLTQLPNGASRPLARVAVRGWIGFIESASIDWVARHTVSREALVSLATNVLLDAIRRAKR
jgi:AcrR family transcriptional regulator